MKTIKSLMSLAILALMYMTPMHSQTHLSIGKNPYNSMALSGTSTLHDWTMKTAEFSGNATFDIQNSNQITTLKALDFSLVVKQLKSGKKPLDKNAYKALKTDQFKTITYKLKSASVPDTKNSDNSIKTLGMLTIAGVSKEVTIKIICASDAKGAVSCTGKYTLKMTDFNVEPPYFMGGLMSTGETVTLDFTMIYEPKAKQPVAAAK